MARNSIESPASSPEVWTVEIKRGPQHDSAATERLDLDKVHNWVKETVTHALMPNPDKECATIHLLVFESDGWQGTGFESKNAHCEAVQDLLEFPHWPSPFGRTVELYHYPPIAETKFVQDNVSQDHYKYGFHFKYLFTQWIYLPATRTTIAFLSNWDSEALEWVSDLTEQPSLGVFDVCHPHALGLWLCSSSLTRLRNDLSGDSGEIVRAQRQMGWHHYSERAFDGLAASPDHSETVNKVVSSATLLASAKLRAAGLAEVAANMLDENSEISRAAGPSPNPSDVVVLRYDRQLKMLGSTAREIERKADEFLTVASTVMQGLYNHIARNDQRINIELAKDSKRIAEISQKVATDTKRDSSSMKSIAAVTMIFLPGTFTASLFATPFFNATSVFTSVHAFWIYWALTIPLTLLTIVAWLLWVKYTERRENDSHQSSPSSPDASV